MASESHDSGIDPRYAPQFQRGFDPARHEAPPMRRWPVRLEGGPPPAAQRVPDPPRSIPIDETVAAEQPAVVAAQDGAPAPAPLTRLDWLLPGLGATLVVISFALWWSLATDTGAYYGNGPTDQWLAFLMYARYELPGPLLISGVLAVTTGLVLQALRPRR